MIIKLVQLQRVWQGYLFIFVFFVDGRARENSGSRAMCAHACSESLCRILGEKGWNRGLPLGQQWGVQLVQLEFLGPSAIWVQAMASFLSVQCHKANQVTRATEVVYTCTGIRADQHVRRRQKWDKWMQYGTSKAHPLSHADAQGAKWSVWGRLIGSLSVSMQIILLGHQESRDRSLQVPSVKQKPLGRQKSHRAAWCLNWND